MKSLWISLFISFAAEAQFSPPAPRYMNFADAEAYCRELGMHLPTTREFAAHAVKHGAVGMIGSGSSAPQGYYKVDGLNPGNVLDTFFFNHQGYDADAGGLKGERLWTATVVPLARDYAHVFYGDWGGGGGEQYEHARSYLNGVRCLP